MRGSIKSDNSTDPQGRRWYVCREAWSFILRRYLPRLAVLSLLWEIAHLPLYTIWQEGRPGWIAFAVAHCTAGDVLIGAAALMLALILSRPREPADWPVARIGVLTVVLGVAYTLLSERLNMAHGNWAYSSWMPVLPGIEVGLSPLIQWIVVPLAALWWARPRAFGTVFQPNRASSDRDMVR